MADIRPGAAADQPFAPPPALIPALELAVPLRIMELRRLSWDSRKALAEGAEQEIVEHGDHILFRGPKKGDSARAFNALVTGLAALALQPGGVSFAGRHWEDRPGAIYIGGPLASDVIDVGLYPAGVKRAAGAS